MVLCNDLIIYCFLSVIHLPIGEGGKLGVEKGRGNLVAVATLKTRKTPVPQRVRRKQAYKLKHLIQHLNRLFSKITIQMRAKAQERSWRMGTQQTLNLLTALEVCWNPVTQRMVHRDLCLRHIVSVNWQNINQKANQKLSQMLRLHQMQLYLMIHQKKQHHQHLLINQMHHL